MKTIIKLNYNVYLYYTKIVIIHLTFKDGPDSLLFIIILIDFIMYTYFTNLFICVLFIKLLSLNCELFVSLIEHEKKKIIIV